MTHVVYEHRESSRRPIVALAAALGGVLAWFGLAEKAPVLYLLPVFAALLMALWMLAAGRISGCELSAQSLRLFAGRWERKIAISDIRSFTITPWSDGPDWITLQLRDEAEYLIPSHCVGNAGRLAAALGTLGISRS